MKKTLYMAGDRGFSNLDWLKSWHTFNFANFYHDERKGFGKMIALNENMVKPSSGFGTRTCDNIEIISIPLEGNLRHKNDLNIKSELGPGDVQVISAGKGFIHSDMNPSETENLRFIEIWVLPEQMDLPPGHRLGRFEFSEGNLVPVILPAGKKGILSVNQQFSLYGGYLKENRNATYRLLDTNNGIFIHVISGSILTCGEKLLQGDAIGLSALENADIKTTDGAFFLLMEIPVEEETGPEIL